MDVWKRFSTHTTHNHTQTKTAQLSREPWLRIAICIQLYTKMKWYEWYSQKHSSENENGISKGVGEARKKNLICWLNKFPEYIYSFIAADHLNETHSIDCVIHARRAVFRTRTRVSECLYRAAELVLLLFALLRMVDFRAKKLIPFWIVSIHFNVCHQYVSDHRIECSQFRGDQVENE